MLTAAFCEQQTAAEAAADVGPLEAQARDHQLYTNRVWAVEQLFALAKCAVQRKRAPPASGLRSPGT